MKTIVFILSTIPNPRNNKRVEVLSKTAKVFVICARRINMDIFPLSEIEGVTYRILDLEIPSSENTFKRIQAISRFAKFCKSQIKMIKPDIIYTGGLDNLFLASIFKKRSTKLCYEVADLREAYTNIKFSLSFRYFRDAIIRLSERMLAHNINLLIVTSKKFFDVHYRKLLSEDKVIEIPNMPDVTAFDTYSPKTDGPFTIGFVGALRYLDQMRLLVDAAGKANVNVIFSGATDIDSDGSFKNYCMDKPWVRFTGKFNYRKDITNIYSKLDCVYSVYDASNFNVTIALPNKLYEAAICELPIIVARNTYLSELVSQWGTGVSIDYDNGDELVTELFKLSTDKSYYNSFVSNCAKVKPTINGRIYLSMLAEKVSRL